MADIAILLIKPGAWDFPREDNLCMEVMWDFHIEGAISSGQPSTTQCCLRRCLEVWNWVDLEQLVD